MYFTPFRSEFFRNFMKLLIMRLRFLKTLTKASHFSFSIYPRSSAVAGNVLRQMTLGPLKGNGQIPGCRRVHGLPLYSGLWRSRPLDCYHLANLGNCLLQQFVSPQTEGVMPASVKTASIYPQGHGGFLFIYRDQFDLPPAQFLPPGVQTLYLLLNLLSQFHVTPLKMF